VCQCTGIQNLVGADILAATSLDIFSISSSTVFCATAPVDCGRSSRELVEEYCWEDGRCGDEVSPWKADSLGEEAPNWWWTTAFFEEFVGGWYGRFYVNRE
jgi:hypothetical protein